MARRQIGNLPTGGIGFRVTVQVSSGGVDLGSIVITRHGTPETLLAATFNEACLVYVPKADAEGNVDYGDNDIRVDIEAEDCAMQSRFGAGDVIVVKSHLEDSLGTVTAGDIDVELADDFDDPLSADDPTDELDQAVAANVNPVAFVYVVDADAQLGDHMITVSTDEDDVDDVTLTVQVAGPPASYSIDGPMYISLGGSGMFTVTALDKEMGIPAFGTEPDEDNMVEVFSPDISADSIRVLTNNQVELDAETGMGTFILYAPRDAQEGEVVRILVSSGPTEVTHTAMFGDDPNPDAVDPPTDTTVPTGEELGKATDIRGR